MRGRVLISFAIRASRPARDRRRRVFAELEEEKKLVGRFCALALLDFGNICYAHVWNLYDAFEFRLIAFIGKQELKGPELRFIIASTDRDQDIRPQCDMNLFL